jgi:predicted O-methyltransferase YrrM
MLEIGFNRGLSALLALSVNPGIRIVNIDICIHPYVEPIHSFIRDLYPGQLDLIAGDSRIVFPSNSPEKFDLYVVDGGHGIECCNADISSCLSHAKHGALLYIDDLDYTEVASVVDRFILQGKIREISFRSQFLKTIYSSVFAI